MPVTNEYDAHVDSKQRVILRGAKTKYFRVRVRKDGVYEFRPKVLVDAPISAATLRCIKNSIASMKAGKRSKPVDLKKLAAMKL